MGAYDALATVVLFINFVHDYDLQKAHDLGTFKNTVRRHSVFRKIYPLLSTFFAKNVPCLMSTELMHVIFVKNKRYLQHIAALMIIRNGSEFSNFQKITSFLRTRSVQLVNANEKRVKLLSSKNTVQTNT